MFFMKTKKIIAALLAVVLATAFVMPASAAELSDVFPENSTEVTASIDDPGTVSYVITIPAAADFGALTQPENTDTDHYTFCDFQIVATELNIKSNQAVTVYMKDRSAEDTQFYISQKDAADPFKIAYDVYDALVTEETVNTVDPINATATPGSYGYHLCTFRRASEGTAQDVTLALNLNSLYGQELYDIAGDYSGTITFHSALVDLGN